MTQRSQLVAMAGAGLLLAAFIPMLGFVLAPPTGPRCATDGVALTDAPVVHLIGPRGEVQRFCCVTCAQSWLDYSEGSVARALVTDANTGDSFDARHAWFTRSGVVAQPATGDRLHAFQSRAAAQEHSTAFGGVVLTSSEVPLTTEGRPPQ